MIYIACPYNHADPNVREFRFKAVSTYAGSLMLNGSKVFSPISHSHPIHVNTPNGLPKTWEFWRIHDLHMLAKCSILHVYKLQGWLESVGVGAEIEFACDLRIPITFINPYSVRLPVLREDADRVTGSP